MASTVCRADSLVSTRVQRWPSLPTTANWALICLASAHVSRLLTNIKSSADPTTRIVTLQELSELLGTSTEGTLADSFQVDAFLRKLVKILGGTGNAADDDDGDDNDDSHRPDEMLDSLLPLLLAEAVSIRATTISRLKSLQLVA